MATPAEGGDRAVERLKVPPHSLEAERAVLGGLMLDNARFEEIADRLVADDFYRRDHQLVFAAISDHADRATPFDVVTIGDWLKSRGELEDAGGMAYLIGLARETPSAVNVKAYGDIVAERAMLRELIRAGGDIAGVAFATEGRSLEDIIDEAERRVFEIAERGSRRRGGFRPVRSLLKETVDRLDQLQRSKSHITGLPTGISDLDEKTAGLQPGDLVIVAGRPSMGKCLAYDSEVVEADGSISTIQSIHARGRAQLFTLNPDWRFGTTHPSDYVDDGVKPVYEVRTRLGRRIQTTLTHPFLTVQGWRRLADIKVGTRIAAPRNLPAFGDECAPAGEASLLGYLLGDGGMTGTCPAFTNADGRLRSDFARAVSEFGPLRTTMHDSGQTRTPTLFVVPDRVAKQAALQAFALLLRGEMAARSATGRSLSQALAAGPATVSQWLTFTSGPSASMAARLKDWILPTDTPQLSAATDAATSENCLRARLEQLGLWGKKAAEKFVPAPVFRWRKEDLAVFLNRLFATDGWVTVLASGQAQLGFVSFSERLARQVQHLLLRFGIVASLKEKRVRCRTSYRRAWQLNITDAGCIARFAREIGIFGKENFLEAALRAIRSRRRQTNVDLVPGEVWKLIEQAKGEESWASLGHRAGLSDVSNLHAHRRALSRKRLRSLASALGSVELLAIADSDVYWDEVVSCEYVGRKQVYDLTVPDTHNFVANDLCVHNTSLAMNIAEHAAISEKKATAIFSMEMPAVQLTMRMLSSLGRIDQGRLRTGRLEEEEWPRVTSVIELMSEAHLYVDDSPGLSPTELRARARRLKREAQGLSLIVIDYLQLMQVPGTRENRATEISEISRSLKSLAKELSVPVVALSQLNRSVEQRPNKRPVMSDLRESGSIEQDADVVMMLYRDEYYNENSADKGLAEIIITKQRNGPTGTVKAAFLERYTRFESYIPEAALPESFG